MAQIPPDITREVFLRLPPETLLRARAVCREWCNIIDDKSFIHSHSIRSQLSPTTLLIGNSVSPRLFYLSADSLIDCADHDQENLEATPVQAFIRPELSRIPDFSSPSSNGLILLYSLNPAVTNWVILNPFTRKFHQLPRLEGLVRCAYVGFGYDSSSDDYKVVAIGGSPRYSRYGYSYDSFLTFVYSMKADSWSKIEDADIKAHRLDRVFIYGFLHCVSKISSLTIIDLATLFYEDVSARGLRGRDIELLDSILQRSDILDLATRLQNSDEVLDFSPRHEGVFFNGFLHWKSQMKYSLTRFDLASQLYDEVPLPETGRGLTLWDFGLLDGCLVVSLYYKEGKCMEGWVMKEKGWIKLFSIENNIGFMRPIAYLRRKGLVLLTKYNKNLFLLDINKNSLRMVNIQGLPNDMPSISSIHCFSGSLVGLDHTYDVTTKRSKANIARTAG